MKTNYLIKQGTIFVVLLSSFLTYCCSDDYSKDWKETEYTPAQKQEIRELAEKYGVQLEFLENSRGKLETVEEIEEIFKALVDMQATYKVPLHERIISDIPGVPIDMPATRSVETESGSGNCSCSYQIEEGENVTLDINVTWSVVYQWLEGTSNVNANPTVNFSIHISGQSSNKGYKYSIGTVSVSNTSVDSSECTKITAHTNFTVLGHGVKGSISLQANADIDVKAKTVSCSIGFFN